MIDACQLCALLPPSSPPPLKPLLTGRWISLCAFGQRAPRFNGSHLDAGTHISTLLLLTSFPLTAKIYTYIQPNNNNITNYLIIVLFYFLLLFIFKNLFNVCIFGCYLKKLILIIVFEKHGYVWLLILKTRTMKTQNISLIPIFTCFKKI